VIDDATLARLATCCRWVPVVTLSRLPHRLRGAEVVRLLVLDRSQSSHFQTPPSRWCDPQDTAPHYNVLCSCCDLTLNEIYLKSHLHSPPRPLQWRPVLPSLTRRLHRLLRGSSLKGNGPRGAIVSGEVKPMIEPATTGCLAPGGGIACGGGASKAPGTSMDGNKPRLLLGSSLSSWVLNST
jgi:hypothetical protein